MLDCTTVNPREQPSPTPPFTTEKVTPVPETPALDSDLGDTNENTSDPDSTGSSAPQASTHRTSRNVVRIDYRKVHTGRASMNKKNSMAGPPVMVDLRHPNTSVIPTKAD